MFHSTPVIVLGSLLALGVVFLLRWFLTRPRHSTGEELDVVGKGHYSIKLIMKYVRSLLRPDHFEFLEPALPLGVTPSRIAPHYKHINVWLSEHEGHRKTLLNLGEIYTLNFKVGKVVDANLLDSKAALLPETDIPEGGLDTEWIIVSKTIQLAPVPGGIQDLIEPLTEANTWVQKFTLNIPKHGDSDLRQLRIKPCSGNEVGLDVLICARGVLYRKFNVAFSVSSAGGDDSQIQGGLRKSKEEVQGLASQLSPRVVPKSWKPPGTLSISVLKYGGAYVQGQVKSLSHIDTQIDWSVPLPQADGRIENLRLAAEAFCAKWGEKYLNNIDKDSLTKRLSLQSYDTLDAASEHQRMWDKEVAVSNELYDLAYYGHELYQTFFRFGTELRSWIDSLDFGWRIDISWSEITTPTWIPHIPWGLMFRVPPDSCDQINPLDFVGLRFRVNYTAHNVRYPKSKALGSLADTYRANCLYWGTQPFDPITAEANWQRNCLSKWPNQIFVPGGLAGEGTGEELRSLLKVPKPNPMPVMYFYCQGEVGRGNVPTLYFGNDPLEVINKKDIGLGPLLDQPLVFVNACLSSAASAYRVNELEQMFFDRGCRAYLGTETYVPIKLGSCFATTFYSYFYRELDPSPIPAGEAVFQSRQFLWRHFRNIGGLLYTYINQYELYMATETELKELFS